MLHKQQLVHVIFRRRGARKATTRIQRASFSCNGERITSRKETTRDEEVVKREI